MKYLIIVLLLILGGTGALFYIKQGVLPLVGAISVIIVGYFAAVATIAGEKNAEDE